MISPLQIRGAVVPGAANRGQAHGEGETSLPPPYQTTNQEFGVNASSKATVHSVGDNLIILHGGKLFSIRVGEGSPALASVGSTGLPNAPGHIFPEEVFVYRRKVVLVSAWSGGHTLLSFYDLGGDGTLSRHSLYLIDARDYDRNHDRNRNLVVRLVNGKLYLYFPHYPIWKEQGRIKGLDAVGGVRLDRARDFRAASSKLPQLVPTSALEWSQGAPQVSCFEYTLHVLLACDLDAPNFSCTGRGAVGGLGRTHHASTESPQAFHIWTDRTWKPNAGDPANQTLWRLPLDGSPFGTLDVWGTTEPHAMRESSDGELRVLVSGANPGLFRIPKPAFAPSTPLSAQSVHATLRRPISGGRTHTRFYEDRLILADGPLGPPKALESAIVVRGLDAEQPKARFSVPYLLGRVEPFLDVPGAAESTRPSSTSRNAQ